MRRLGIKYMKNDPTATSRLRKRQDRHRFSRNSTALRDRTSGPAETYSKNASGPAQARLAEVARGEDAEERHHRKQKRDRRYVVRLAQKEVCRGDGEQGILAQHRGALQPLASEIRDGRHPDGRAEGQDQRQEHEKGSVSRNQIPQRAHGAGALPLAAQIHDARTAGRRFERTIGQGYLVSAASAREVSTDSSPASCPRCPARSNSSR